MNLRSLVFIKQKNYQIILLLNADSG